MAGKLRCQITGVAARILDNHDAQAIWSPIIERRQFVCCCCATLRFQNCPPFRHSPLSSGQGIPFNGYGAGNHTLAI
jgi:hypothetical protein